MEIDNDKIDDTVLALLHLTSFTDRGVTRAWKSHDWDSLNRLHEKAIITNPRTRAKSVVLTDEGAKRAAELFNKLFQKAG
jgi:hypothetical protein